MNIRKLKRTLARKMYFTVAVRKMRQNAIADWNKAHKGQLDLPDEVIAGLMVEIANMKRVNEPLYVTEPDQVFEVVKKTTGELVGAFDTHTEAQEMIDAAKRGKKAVLVHMAEFEAKAGA